jgi:RNA polymerase sigma factor (sigma-70 family)
MRTEDLALEKTNQILEDIHKMVWDIIHGYNLSHDVKQDICQEAMIFLWQSIIPKYDETRGAKFSSFAYRCVVNFINKKIKILNRRRLNTISVDSEKLEGMASYEHDVCFDDDPRGKLEELIDFNEGKMSEKEKTVLRLMRDVPHITQREIADIVGFKHPSAVSMLLKRVRKRIKRPSDEPS